MELDINYLDPDQWFHAGYFEKADGTLKPTYNFRLLSGEPSRYRFILVKDQFLAIDPDASRDKKCEFDRDLWVIEGCEAN